MIETSLGRPEQDGFGYDYLILISRLWRKTWFGPGWEKEEEEQGVLGGGASFVMKREIERTDGLWDYLRPMGRFIQL